MPDITSVGNDKIKWLGRLHKSQARRELGLFLVEGRKEVKFALDNDYRPHSFYYFGDKPELPDAAEAFSLSREAYQKISYRDSQQNNLLGVFYDPKKTLDDIKLSKDPFLIVLESVEKPGNLGAIARIADGCSADAVIVTGDFNDIYNPNAIRASVGTIFSKAVVAATNEEVLELCRAKKLKLFGAALTPTAQTYTQANLNQPLALVLGSEAHGLSDLWLQNCERIIIPMRGQNDSLNVSAATAILAYEVVRQQD